MSNGADRKRSSTRSSHDRPKNGSTTAGKRRPRSSQTTHGRITTSAVNNNAPSGELSSTPLEERAGRSRKMRQSEEIKSPSSSQQGETIRAKKSSKLMRRSVASNKNDQGDIRSIATKSTTASNGSGAVTSISQRRHSEQPRRRNGDYRENKTKMMRRRTEQIPPTSSTRDATTLSQRGHSEQPFMRRALVSASSDSYRVNNAPGESSRDDCLVSRSTHHGRIGGEYKQQPSSVPSLSSQTAHGRINMMRRRDPSSDINNKDTDQIGCSTTRTGNLWSNYLLDDNDALSSRSSHRLSTRRLSSESKDRLLSSKSAHAFSSRRLSGEAPCEDLSLSSSRRHLGASSRMLSSRSTGSTRNFSMPRNSGGTIGSSGGDLLSSKSEHRPSTRRLSKGSYDLNLSSRGLSSRSTHIPRRLSDGTATTTTTVNDGGLIKSTHGRIRMTAAEYKAAEPSETTTKKIRRRGRRGEDLLSGVITYADLNRSSHHGKSRGLDGNKPKRSRTRRADDMLMGVVTYADLNKSSRGRSRSLENQLNDRSGRYEDMLKSYDDILNKSTRHRRSCSLDRSTSWGRRSSLEERDMKNKRKEKRKSKNSSGRTKSLKRIHEDTSKNKKKSSGQKHKKRRKSTPPKPESGQSCFFRILKTYIIAITLVVLGVVAGVIVSVMLLGGNNEDNGNELPPTVTRPPSSSDDNEPGSNKYNDGEPPTDSTGIPQNGNNAVPTPSAIPEEDAKDPFEGLKNGAADKWYPGKLKEGLRLEVLNALDETYQDIFNTVMDEWDSPPKDNDGKNLYPDALSLTIKQVPVEPDCEPVLGKLKVCNGDYGPTGYRGINKWVSKHGWIVSSISKMNDYYLRNTKNGVIQYTMCHECGHAWGLGHTDEDFTNADLGNCLDYTRNLGKNKSPDGSNYETLRSMYGTVLGDDSPEAITSNYSKNEKAGQRTNSYLRGTQDRILQRARFHNYDNDINNQLVDCDNLNDDQELLEVVNILQPYLEENLYSLENIFSQEQKDNTKKTNQFVLTQENGYAKEFSYNVGCGIQVRFHLLLAEPTE